MMKIPTQVKVAKIQSVFLFLYGQKKNWKKTHNLSVRLHHNFFSRLFCFIFIFCPTMFSCCPTIKKRTAIRVHQNNLSWDLILTIYITGLEKSRTVKLKSRPFNTSSLTESYIIFTLKMESVSENTIFGLKMMVKSGLEKIILKFLHAQAVF